MFISKVIAAWVAAFNVFADYVALMGVNYGFSPEQIAEVEAERTNLNNAWSSYQDAGNRTPIIVEILHRRVVETKNLARYHRKRIKATYTNLPAEAIAGFGITVDKKPRAKLPTITFAPGNVWEKIVHLVTRIYTFDMREGSERHLGKPDDVEGIIRWLAYTPAGVTEAPVRSAYGAGVTVTGKTLYEIEHAPDKVGMNCWLITAYYNSSGNGPESEPLMFPVA